MVEVVVRNSLDRQMTEWALKRGKVDWLVHAPLDVRAKLDVQKAKERAALGRRRVTHGHVGEFLPPGLRLEIPVQFGQSRRHCFT